MRSATLTVAAEAGEGLQGIQFDPFEAFGVEGVEGQQAPGFVIDKQRAAHAVMNLQVPMHALHQAVIGIGQFTVTVETRRVGAAEQHGEARVFADLETSAQGIGAQTVHGQWHQRLAVQAQQRGGVAGQQGAHGV